MLMAWVLSEAQIALYFVFTPLQSLDPVVNTTPIPPIPISRGAPRGPGGTECSLPQGAGAVLLGDPPKQDPVKEHASALDRRPRRCCLRRWVLHLVWILHFLLFTIFYFFSTGEGRVS